ncbi:DPP IV N-terminal domain-containing protein [Winogradskyella sp. 3972H.M.0a.05]|uniref:TolB family protein n=1 Tax=Winogradskyella sp. 3972H.M.0a.05 TaxID=2950277 RepID=UPI00339320DA
MRKRFLLVTFFSLSMTVCFSQIEANKIMFSRCKGTLLKGGNIDIMTIDPSGEKESLIIKGTVPNRGEYNAYSSPKGNFLSFNTYRYSGWKIAIAPIKIGTVGNPTKFTNSSDYEYNLSWSPDESKVVFQVFNWNSNDQDIYIANADRTNMTNITNQMGGDRTPSFSKDGKSVLFTTGRYGSYDICLMDLKGNIIKNYTQDNLRSHDFAPSFSPDGEKISFLSNRDKHCDLYIIDKNNEIINLTEGKISPPFIFNGWSESASWGYKTSWSPDGSSIAFCMSDGNDLEIYTINIETKELRKLTDNDYDDFSPFWVK